MHSKKHKRSGIKMYKLCDRLVYRYNISVYLRKQINLASMHVTPGHRTISQVVWKTKIVGHKNFMDNYFS
jgi:hypothetical protein